MSLNIRPCWGRHLWSEWSLVREVDTFWGQHDERPSRREGVYVRTCDRCGIEKTKRVDR